MRKIKGWNDAAVQQFVDGYGSYPANVLQDALAAGTFEEMTAVLDAHARTKAQLAMARAYPIDRTLPQDADDPQTVAAKTLAAKTLGDDARDLVFIPVTPCTVWDSRFATNPASSGVIGDGVTKRFYSHMDGAGGSYAPYGGNPSCPETAQNALGVRPFAVMMTVYVNDATANGWLTFYRDGDPDPSSATISVYYSAGPTRTQTVISKSSRGYGTGAYDVAVTGRFGTATGSASVVGYFLKAVVPPPPATGQAVYTDIQLSFINPMPSGQPSRVLSRDFTVTGNSSFLYNYQVLMGNAGAVACQVYTRVQLDGTNVDYGSGALVPVGAFTTIPGTYAADVASGTHTIAVDVEPQCAGTGNQGVGFGDGAAGTQHTLVILKR